MDVIDRLSLIFEWYKRAVCEDTGRFFYVYVPERDLVVADGSPIRDLGTLWDVEVLAHYLGRDDLASVVERSLDHWCGLLEEHEGALCFDTDAIGEPSNIAHSAFLLLALLLSRDRGRGELVEKLATGLLRQQRSDGSWRVHFGGAPDSGMELYPGEAMLALVEAARASNDPALLASVERGFAWCERRHARGRNIDDDLLVFFTNWQSQAFGALAAATPKRELAKRICDYVFGLNDAVVGRGFYADVARRPERQATVEVACALEGINEAYRLARRFADARRERTYEDAAHIALSFLLTAQRIDRCTERERGGFGHSLGDRTQRIDVTGHVLGALIKCVQNGVTPVIAAHAGT